MLWEKIRKKTYVMDIAIVFNAPSETLSAHCCDNSVAVLVLFLRQLGQKSLPITLRFDALWVDCKELDMSEQDIGIGDK